MKNSNKIISAIVAAALCTQCFVFSPLMANAAIDVPFSVITTNSTEDDTTIVSDATAATSISLGKELKGSYKITFDLTLTGELASGTPDKTASNGAYFSFKGGKVGPYLISSGYNASTNTQTFTWQTTSNGGSFGMEIGVPYHFELSVSKGSTDEGSGTLVVTNTETKAEVFNASGLNLRNYSSTKDCSGGGISQIEVFNRVKTPTASMVFGPITVESATPEAIQAFLGETELTADENIIEIDAYETTTLPYSANAILNGAVTSDFAATSLLTIDSDEAAFYNDKTNSELVIDSSLPVGEYDVVLKTQISGDDATIVECPITLVKKDVTGEQVANAFKERITVSSADSTITDFALNNVYDNINLVSTWGEYDVSWTTSIPEIISEEGVVIPAAEDTNVILTASIDVDGETVSQDIEVTVKGAKAEAQKALDAIVMQDSSLMIVNPANVTSDFAITYPTYTGKYVTISYEDTNGFVDVDANGNATIYPSEDGNNAVNLVATATYSKNGVDVVSVEKTFPMTITTSPKAVVDTAIAGDIILNADTSAVADLSNVSYDLILPEKVGGVEFINWSSDNDFITISKNGKTAEICGDEIASETGTISAEVVYKKGDVVLYSTTYEKDITVVLSEDMADKYIVRCDAAASKNFANCPDEGDTIRSADDICDGKGLPTEGIFGSDIEWTSSVPKAISNTGKTVKKQSVRKLVTLTATISKGSAEAETYKIEDLIVPAASGSSGGSGGSSSSNSNTTVSSTGNRASNVSYKGTLAPTTSLQKGDITTASVVSFSDLGDAAWAKEAVTFLANKAIINGKTASSFAPNDDITRAEFAKIVVKAFGLEDANASVSSFSDVSASDWYYTAVASAYNKGIIKGYENGTFGVNDKITRQDMAVIIYRAAQVAGKTIEATKAEVAFADSADIATYAAEAVATLQKGGVINGMTATTFAPTATATRAQAAQMIYGLVK